MWLKLWFLDLSESTEMIKWKQKTLTRMIEYRQTVIIEKERLDDAILKLEFELAQLEVK